MRTLLRLPDTVCVVSTRMYALPALLMPDKLPEAYRNPMSVALHITDNETHSGSAINILHVAVGRVSGSEVCPAIEERVALLRRS